MHYMAVCLEDCMIQKHAVFLLPVYWASPVTLHYKCPHCSSLARVQLVRWYIRAGRTQGNSLSCSRTYMAYPQNLTISTEIPDI